MDTSKEPETRTPSQEFQNFDAGLRRALAVPKSEIDKREKDWQTTEHKRGRPKKAKTETNTSP